MLENHTIYYDDNCPVCKFFSKGLVRLGVLSEHAVHACGDASSAVHSGIDLSHTRNEIVLYDRANHTVSYGIDGLFTVIGTGLPAVRSVLHWRPFQWLMIQCYALLSHNRKVIAPPGQFQKPSRNSSGPHLGYRWAYIGLAWLLTAVVYESYFALLAPVIDPGNIWRELIIGGELAAFQSILVWFVKRDRLIHYLGNMMTVSLTGALLLLPAYVLFHIFYPEPTLVMGYYVFTVTVMFLEHVRRVRRLGLDWRITAGWTVFRSAILFLMLYR